MRVSSVTSIKIYFTQFNTNAIKRKKQTSKAMDFLERSLELQQEAVGGPQGHRVKYPPLLSLPLFDFN